MGKDPSDPGCNDRLVELAEIVGVEETVALMGIWTCVQLAAAQENVTVPEYLPVPKVLASNVMVACPGTLKSLAAIFSQLPVLFVLVAI